MAAKSRIKKMVKPYVNVRYWVSYDEHKSTWQKLSQMIRNLVMPQALPGHEETFDQAVARLQLSQTAIQQRKQQCLLAAIGFFLAALASTVYTGYLMYSREFAVSFLGLGVTSLLYVYAFRYHFWYFQIKNRVLGATFHDWWHAKIKG